MGHHGRERRIERRQLMVVAVVAVSSLLSSACAEQEMSALDQRPLAARMASLQGTASFEPPLHRTSVELSPTTKYRSPDGEEMVLSEAVAVGRLSAVTPDRSLSYAGGPTVAGEPSKRKDLPFNDPEGDIDVVRVEMDTTRSVTADGSVLPATIQFGLVLPAPTDLASLERELLGLGEVAVILSANDHTAFTWSEMFGVAGYGACLGSVVDGVVTFNTIAPSPHGFAPEAVSVDQLFAGAGVIPLQYESGMIVRAESAG